jgi:hypothetical protein
MTRTLNTINALTHLATVRDAVQVTRPLELREITEATALLAAAVTFLEAATDAPLAAYANAVALGNALALRAQDRRAGALHQALTAQVKASKVANRAGEAHRVAIMAVQVSACW